MQGAYLIRTHVVNTWERPERGNPIGNRVDNGIEFILRYDKARFAVNRSISMKHRIFRIDNVSDMSKICTMKP